MRLERTQYDRAPSPSSRHLTNLLNLSRRGCPPVRSEFGLLRFALRPDQTGERHTQDKVLLQAPTHFKRYANRYLFALFVLLFLAVWLISPQRLITSDPWGYSQIAYLISQGDLIAAGSGNIFVHRLGATLPTGLFYYLFGVSLFTTNLAPLLSALLMLALIWYVLPTRGAKLVGVALCATNLTFFQMSVNLYPDIISAAFMCLSTVILSQRERVSAKRWFWLPPVVAVLSLFFAFLAKLSAYWMLPLWLGALIVDARRRRTELLRRFYLPVLIAAALTACAYLLYNQFAWGSALIRFTNVSDAVEVGLWAITGTDRPERLFDRLTVDALRLILEHFGVIFVPALASAFFLPPHLRIWAYATFCPVLLYWFGTTSLLSYQPMPLFDRMLLPALPGMCILAAYGITEVLRPAGLRRVVAVLVVAIAAFQFNGHIRTWKDIRWFEKEAAEVLKQDMAADNQLATLVVTLDTRSPLAMEFFFEYAYPQNLTVVAADEFQTWPPEQVGRFERIYIYQDRQMAAFLNAAYDEPLLELTTPPSLTVRLYEQAGITLDSLKGGTR